MRSMSGPIIVTALLGREDLAWADSLRRAHFPVEHNRLPAHLTLFHHLPPSALQEIKRLLRDETRMTMQPAVRTNRLLPFGRGVALAIESTALAAIRERMAEAMAGRLTAQDSGGWRPHITIQNKATPGEARALFAALQRDFQPRAIEIIGLAAHFYRGGPWESIAEYRFNRVGRSRRS